MIGEDTRADIRRLFGAGTNAKIIGRIAAFGAIFEARCINRTSDNWSPLAVRTVARLNINQKLIGTAGMLLISGLCSLSQVKAWLCQ